VTNAYRQTLQAPENYVKADYFAIGLLIVYVIATLLYAREYNWPKVMYFGGSAIITLGIILSH